MFRSRGEIRGRCVGLLAAAAALLAVLLPTAAIAEPHLEEVARFRSTIDVRVAPGYPRLLFVADITGKVWVIRRGKALPKPFLNIRRLTSFGNERGLLSMAFPPDYRRTGRFYVYYVDRRGDVRLDEFRRRTAVRADRRSLRHVLRIPHSLSTSHYGGQIRFNGPLLFVSTGDGGIPGDPDRLAQDPGSLFGKFLRINPKPSGGRPYTVPASNPFVGIGRPEVFATGLRNPFRWTFDRYSGDQVHVAVTDVGFSKYEELNYLPLSELRGANFGWSAYEGLEPTGEPLPGTVEPQFVLPHPESCAIIGGVVVRDEHLPSLLGRYLFSDFCNTRLRSVLPGRSQGAIVDTGIELTNVTSITEGPAGGVYATSYSGGLYRLKP
ncbi:MAG: PQQ-dependent sugar dehydrogenase [Solirubrobacterales bacterium]|nr:PQQ-dependent sugar dehydrogenase [Solirubrobacterales bacterium]